MEQSKIIDMMEKYQGLPPIQGIEHQIDLIPDASLPNHAPYRTNPEETKEIMRQVQELLDKGVGVADPTNTYGDRRTEPLSIR